MEGRIQEIFSLGKKWGAIVLLDEADVLMSKRTVDSLDRNAVVSGMLTFHSEDRFPFRCLGSYQQSSCA